MPTACARPRRAASAPSTMAETGGPQPREIMTDGRVPQRARRAAGDRRLDQRAGPPDRGRRAGSASRIDLDEFDRLGREVPVLVDLKPSGKHYMEHFHWAGGVPRLLRELERPARSRRAARSTGETLRDDRRGGRRRAERRTSSAPRRPDQRQPAAWRCCAATSRRAARSSSSRRPAPALMTHTGRAVVFEIGRGPGRCASTTRARRHRRRRAGAAQRRPDRRARHAGGRLPADPAKLAQQGVKDMVRISDARMSGTAFGTIVLHITPEAALGGPLALVRDGDTIRARRRRPARSSCWSTTPSWRAAGAEFERQGAPGAAPTPDRGYAALFHRTRAAGRRGLRLRLPGAGAARRRDAGSALTSADGRSHPRRRRALHRRRPAPASTSRSKATAGTSSPPSSRPSSRAAARRRATSGSTRRWAIECASRSTRCR